MSVHATLGPHGVEKAIAIGAALAGNAVAWGQSIALSDWSIGGAVTSITALSAALIGAIVFGLRQLGPAWADFRRHLEDAHKESLSGQLVAVQESLGHARHSLHELRNEYATERLQHAAEAERLSGQIELLHETIRQLRAEIDRLNARIRELTGATQAVSDKIGSSPPPSSDQITPPPPTAP